MTLFQPSRHKSADGAYEFYLGSKYQQDVRDFVDQMHSEVKDYIGDPNFGEMLQTDFHATVWQLYVSWSFLKYGRAKLLKPAAHGPDVILEDGTIIEAVTATRGDGPDKPFAWKDVEPIEKTELGYIHAPRAMAYPDPQIILRITNAIKSKIEQYERWVSGGIVRAEQPFVIAVNAGLIDEAADAFGGSYIARVAFALGEDVFVVPVNMSGGGGDLVQSYNKIEHRPSVTKQSGSAVRSDLFLHEGYASISGLLFSPHHIGNFVRAAPKDLEYVSNGFARNALPRELLQGVRYIWAEIDKTQHKYMVHSEPKLK